MKKLLSLLLAILVLCAFSAAAYADGDDFNIINGDFETGDLTGWTVPDNWARDENGKPLGVISDASYWAEEMPYNQGGNYHLDGWNNGIPENETWAIQSSSFTLGEKLYVELRDEKVNAWAQAFFDEVVTYYETAPDFESLFDTVKDGASEDTVDIPWTLAENKADEILNPPPPPPAPVDPWYVPDAPNPFSVVNGGFETGTLAGWTPVSGNWAKD